MGGGALNDKWGPMQPIPLPLPVVSAPGQRPHESAGRLINAYAERLANGAPAEFVRRRVPGVMQFASTAQTGNRGQIIVGNTLYAAFSGAVRRFDSAGTETTVGNLSGTRKVFWARNTKSPTPDLVVVDPDNGAFTVTAGSVSSLSVPSAPNSVCFLDGYFFFTTGAGACYASGLNSTTINALDVAIAQTKPDGLYRAIAFGDLYLCGDGSIEIYRNTANPTAFPFTRAYSIPKGILGPNAVSGYEDGFGKGLYFVGDDKFVYTLNGYTPVRISTPDVDRAIETYVQGGGSVNNIEMFPYIHAGHSCLALKSPSWTWVFDLDTQWWHERKSYGLEYWRATGAINAFGKWLAGWDNSGKLVEITSAARDELGDPLRFRVESAPASDFPNSVSIAQAMFDMTRGVGIATGADPMQTDPTVELSWSKDGGYSWSAPILRKLGAQSVVSPKPLAVAKVGMSTPAGVRFRIDVTDAVDVGLLSASLLPEVRRAVARA